MTELAKRYGGSLYDLAAEEQLTDQLLAELDVALDCFNQEPAYLRLLSTPGVPKKERCALLDKAFAEAHPYLVNFLKLLCEENLLAELPGCVRAYRDRYNADHGIIEATVVSAVPLNDTSREKLLAKLQEMTGKTVRLTAKVDPSILGGLRLRYWHERGIPEAPLRAVHPGAQRRPHLLQRHGAGHGHHKKSGGEDGRNDRMPQ